VRVTAPPVLVAPAALLASAHSGIDLPARVSSPHRQVGPDRQEARLTGWAGRCDLDVMQAGVGMAGARFKARRLLAGKTLRCVAQDAGGGLSRVVP
jgi:hypothetical protein